MKYLAYFTVSKAIVNEVQIYLAKPHPEIAKIPRKAFHCNLLSLHSDEKNEDRIISELERITSSGLIPDITAEITGFRMYDNNAFGADIKRTPEMLDLHELVVDGLKQFVTWDETPPLAPEYLRDTQRKMIYESTGTPYAKVFFMPHITIAYLQHGINGATREETDETAGNNKMRSPTDIETPDIVGKIWEVKSIVLAKKQDGWRVIKDLMIWSQNR